MKKMFLLTMFLAVNAYAGDTDMGNGGDIAYCTPSSSNSFSGYLSLDYLATYSEYNSNSDIVEVTSWEESAQRIRSFIKIFYSRQTLAGFDDFIATLDNHTDYSMNRIWLSSSEDLVDIKDENLIRQIPHNCRYQGNSTKAIQAVIRVESDDFLTYYSDKKILDELRTKPLQYSFLVVHEWLRDFAQNSLEIRNINRLIHSDQWEKMPRIDIQITLDRFSQHLITTSYSNNAPSAHVTANALTNAINAGNLDEIKKVGALSKGYINLLTVPCVRNVESWCRNNDLQNFLETSKKYKLFLHHEKRPSALLTPFLFAIIQGNSETVNVLAPYALADYPISQYQRSSPFLEVKEYVSFALALGREDIAQLLVSRGFDYDPEIPATYKDAIIAVGFTKSNLDDYLLRIQREWGIQFSPEQVYRLAVMNKSREALEWAVRQNALVESAPHELVDFGKYHLYGGFETITFRRSCFDFGDCFKKHDVKGSFIFYFLTRFGVNALRFLKENGQLERFTRLRYPAMQRYAGSTPGSGEWTDITLSFKTVLKYHLEKKILSEQEYGKVLELLKPTVPGDFWGYVQ